MFKKVKDKSITEADLEIIAWEGKTTGVLGASLMYIFPKKGEDIKNKKYFAVKDYEKALFYNKGKLIDELGGGIYKLDKKSRYKGTEIVWIDTSLLEIPWGVPELEGIPTKDGFTIGLYGDLKLTINNIKVFYNEIVAGKKEWTVQDLRKWLKGSINTSLRDIFKNYKTKQIILEEREQVLELVTAKVKEEFKQYGLELNSFNILGVKYPDEFKNTLDQDKDMTEAIAKMGKESVDKLIKQQEGLEIRIKELKDKLKEQQDLLIKGDIIEEEYEERKETIQRFINETQTELDEINDILLNI